MGLSYRIARAYAQRQVPVAIGGPTTRMRVNMPATLPGSSLAGALLASLSVVLSGACTSTPKTDPAAAAASASAASTAAASASAAPATPPGYADSPGSDDLRPVYPMDAGAPDPTAERFCDAVYLLPERRRGECCGTQSGVAAGLGAQCVRALTFALHQKALALAPEDVDRCAEAMTRTTSGCDWVTTFAVAMPPECDGVIRGALKEKAQCRSSLECAEGMHCLGLSTIDLGVCGPPKATRVSCDMAVDMLATFTRQDHLDRVHPECAGYCYRGHCAEAIAEGGACSHDRACAPGWCSSGKCTRAPRPAMGEACGDACAPGARCVKGKCAAPKAERADCEVNEECRGACVHGDGGAAGTCKQSCPVYTVPRIPEPIVGPGAKKPRKPAR
jgi:hypothetical protein